MEKILNDLRAVLCDPEGKCCISGSDADRAIVDSALAALATQQEAQPQAEPTEWPTVPDLVMELVQVYGDARADEKYSALRLSELIYALRQWAGTLNAAHAEPAGGDKEDAERYDKVQSIMELVDTITDCAQKGYPFSNMRIVLESAIREAIAAPGVATPTPTPPPCATCDGAGGWERANSSTSYSWEKCPHCQPSPTAEQHDHFDEVVKMVPPASSPVDAARSVAKWLNERPNRPIDLRDVAMLVHHVQSQCDTIKGGPAE